MKQALEFVANMNKNGGDAKIVGELVGKVLWVEICYDQGVIQDAQGNEYYFNPSSCGGAIDNQLVRFTVVQTHSPTPCYIALDVQDYVVNLTAEQCEGGNAIVSPDSDHCEVEKCQACCPHNEFDHNICLDCEKEFDVLPGYDEDYGSDR